MNIITFILFFVISGQGISIYIADGFLAVITSISIVTIILLILTLLNLVYKRDKILKKIGFIFKFIINIGLSIVILLISHSIYVLSTGNWE